jgi:UDP-N-acetylglucosamine--N-acetylmuramyl-(pentapeptide) pyrophosphoryl-undecaprenol N-acetylglucosamine transferase
MRLIITGGGSGGHIYPALAIADEICKQEPGSEVLYIGNHVGLETEIVPKSGYDMKLVAARWFEKTPLGVIKTSAVTLHGSNQSLRIMKKFKPDAVVGTGGFVCVPVIHAAHRYGCKVYIHEQNAFPGVANRFLERYVDRVFLGFGDASQYFKQKEKHTVVGNPVRDRFFHVDRDVCREKLGLSKDDFVIFSFAGSQGANQMTRVIYEVMKQLNGKKSVVLLFGTGTLHYGWVQDHIKEDGIDLKDNIRIMDYINDMENYLGASDLVISRAGALSVAETCVTGRASILVPSPNVPGNHQYFNARSVSDHGGAILIEEKDFTLNKVMQEIYHLQEHPEELRAMEQAAVKCAPTNATERIYQFIRSDLDNR